MIIIFIFVWAIVGMLLFVVLPDVSESKTKSAIALFLCGPIVWMVGICMLITEWR